MIYCIKSSTYKTNTGALRRLPGVVKAGTPSANSYAGRTDHCSHASKLLRTDHCVVISPSSGTSHGLRPLLGAELDEYVFVLVGKALSNKLEGRSLARTEGVREPGPGTRRGCRLVA